MFNKENIQNLDFDNKFASQIQEENRYEFFGECGRSHYRLLSYISTLFHNSKFVNIISPLVESQNLPEIALSYNETNEIQTIIVPSYSNVIDNIRDVINSPFIFVDIHPHDGKMEKAIYDFLKENDYQGIVLFDDIWLFKTMRDDFWYHVPPENAYDITNLGHFSGCGLVSFNQKVLEKWSQEKYNVSNWTLVTAYFNLTKCSDASQEICARDKSYYFQHATATLSLPYNLVVYCDEDSYEDVRKMRPKHLEEKTQYIIRDFEELTFTKERDDFEITTFAKYREKIIDNRKKHPYHFDNRNTASYYLFCMSRYLMLKEVITENKFQSTHFAWINFCIERMGYKNLIHLEEGLAQNRDCFSTCYIDYIPETMVRNTKEYFLWGRCSMCSGFFTGSANYMYKVCDLIEDAFLSYLEEGYGHADEQLFSPVYFNNPELFEHYYGDYLQMITNYVHVYDAPEPPIYNFIRNSYYAKNYEKCIEACEFMFRSLERGCCVLNEQYTKWLNEYYTLCHSQKNG
jgi:hypothetical protein